MNTNCNYGMMDRYHGDECFQEDKHMHRSMNDFNLYDLMAIDHSVWVKKNEKFGFDLEIEDDEGQTIVHEKGIHPYAIESLAGFCRNFLHFYSNTQKAE